MLYNNEDTGGYPMVDLDSDLEATDSSEDDIDVILHGTPEQKRKLRRHSQSLDQKASSSEDEFEKEMQRELNDTVEKIAAKQECKIGEVHLRKTSEHPDFYNDDYFDSDSDEEVTSTDKKKVKHPVLSNDDLLYDPDMDDQDQKWVDNQRQRYQPTVPLLSEALPPRGKTDKTITTGTNHPNKPKRLPNSDAVLNCPACMTLLCLDCQRHEKFKSQYRAMFVVNCNVEKTEVLHYPNNKQQKKKSKIKEVNKPAGDECVASCSDKDSSFVSADQFHPVRCKTCTTEVGVYDRDEIFHFFNVLASYT